MLELIFGDSMFETIKFVAIIAAIVGVFLIFARYKPAQGFVYGALLLVLIGTATFSFGSLNNYYSASGGVIGELTSLVKKNEVTISQEVDDIIFDFTNVVLMENSKGKYSATMTTEEIIMLDANESYFIYVNETPCNTVKCEATDIYATYNYTFLNREDGEYLSLADDEMTFYFAFYKNYSYLYIEVENGADTYKLWNAYFNKNSFSVKVVKVPTEFYEQTNYPTINLNIKDSTQETIKVKKGTTYILPETYELEGYRFMGWSFDGATITSETSIQVVEDLTIYAIFEKLYYVRYCYLNDSTIDQNSNIFAVESYINGEKFSSVNPGTPTRNNYSFLGWSLDGESVIDLNKTTQNGTITNLYAVWQAENIEVNIYLNGGSMTIDGMTYTEDFTTYFSADEKLILNKPTKTGFDFYYYTIESNGTSFNTTDATISLTINDIFKLFYGSSVDYPSYGEDASDNEITSLKITTYYIETSEDEVSITDDEMKTYIAFYWGISYTESSGDDVVEIVDNETFIKNFYYTLTYIEPSADMTLFEIETIVLEYVNATCGTAETISEDITTSEYLTILYNLTQTHFEN